MMKKLIFALVLLVSLPAMAESTPAPLVLASPAFLNGETIPNRHVFNRFGCTGENVSPALEWQNVPAGTKALALTVYDPDAPTGSGWWHWVLFNLSPKLTGLPAGAGSPDGQLLTAGTVQSMTDYGSPGYGGPCPPQGNTPHRYIFTLYALKDVVPLEAKASGAMVGYYLNQLAIARATLTGKYGREK